MLRKIWIIFMRDLKVNMRNFLTLYIILFPVIFAIGINLLTPSINETTVEIALIDNENIEMQEYLEDFAKVELFKDEDAVIYRVEKRDNIVGILPEGDGNYILSQGNEPQNIIDFAKMLKTFYELDAKVENTNATITEFGETVPPLKSMLVNITLIFISVLGGMLIALNIVEEKVDNTISAINVSPVSRNMFILGKSMIGITYAIFGSIAVLIITGFGNVNVGQVLVAIFACSLLSLMIGFIQGLKSDDVMTAAGSVKLLFLPLGAAIAAIELLSDKWQVLFYWIPFYWTYKGNNAVLSYDATWLQILLYTGIVVVLCGVVYLVLAPKIRKGLE